jgi:heme exporter protein D
MDLGPHAAFIWMSYAAVSITVIGLVLWLVADGARQRADLSALERQGIKRRSSAQGEA